MWMGLLSPFSKGKLERGFVYCMAQKSRQRDYVRSFPRSQCSVLPYCETCVLSLMFPAEGRRGVTKQIDKRATSIVYSMAKRTQRSTLIPHASRHETEHGVLPPDHPSIPHEFSESGVDLVLNATERRVVPFHDSAPCHFAALPPGHGAQNKSRSKKVTLASNCLPDFFITCGRGVTTQRSPEASGRRRSLGEASLHFGFPPRRTEGPVEATTRGFRRVKKGIS